MFKILIIFVLLCSLAQSFTYPNYTSCASVYEYKYPNDSCLSDCPSPYRRIIRNDGSKFCILPCSSGFFNVWTDTCAITCRLEDVTIEDDILHCNVRENVGENGCPDPTEFKHPNGTCVASCPFPTQVNWRDGSYFSDQPCPDSFLFEDDKSCFEYCEPGWAWFDEDEVAYCARPSDQIDGCPRSHPVKYFNGSCGSPCEYPFDSRWVGGIIGLSGHPICGPNCKSPSYWSPWANRCVFCAPEDVKDVNEFLVCDSPPLSNTSNGCPFLYEFKYPNDSCLSDCLPPCPGQYFNDITLICVDTCENEFIRFGADIAYCSQPPASPDDPCPNYDEWRYPNDSCLESCSSPHVSREVYGNYFCDLPCPPNKYFNVWNGSCSVYCEPEFIGMEDSNLLCEHPSPADNDCPLSTPFKYWNGTCRSSCQSPFRSDGSFFCFPPDCPIGQFFNFWTVP